MAKIKPRSLLARVEAARRNAPTQKRCPFAELPPVGAKTHRVPSDLHNLVVLAHELREAARVFARQAPTGNGDSFNADVEADAVATILSSELR
ncbi:MAG: hypothetical protein U1D26_00725, partial [Patescibacteria group bacterium]|nr:hypothetical protein [Patescibacteria group bacterium]